MISKAQVLAEAARLRARFEAAGAVPVEAAILQSAETLLDLYGEDIRARAFVTHDPLRGELMLRPDFTVPVVEQHMQTGAEPARYTYAGEVFRQQEVDPSRPSEFVQVGIEIFDGSAPEQADAEVFSLIAEALAPLNLRAATGDIGILRAAVQGLSTSPERRAALMRHLWRPRRFRTLLDRFAGRRAPPATRTALLNRMAQGEYLLDGAGPMIGLRSAEEITARLDRLAADSHVAPIPEFEVQLLEQILSLKGPSTAVLENLRDIAVDLPAISDAVQTFAIRLDALAAKGVDIYALEFEASFGRTTMEYYDGFVFGFMVPGRPDLPAIATGGRYDALTRILGQGRAIPAVGGMIRPQLALSLTNATGASS